MEGSRRKRNRKSREYRRRGHDPACPSVKSTLTLRAHCSQKMRSPEEVKALREGVLPGERREPGHNSGPQRGVLPGEPVREFAGKCHWSPRTYGQQRPDVLFPSGVVKDYGSVHGLSQSLCLFQGSVLLQHSLSAHEPG